MILEILEILAIIFTPVLLAVCVVEVIRDYRR